MFNRTVRLIESTSMYTSVLRLKFLNVFHKYLVKTKFQKIRMLSQKIFHPIMYRVRLDRPVGHLVGCKKVFTSILVLSNCFAKLCFLFGPRDRLLDVEKYLDFLLWFTRYITTNSGTTSPNFLRMLWPIETCLQISLVNRLDVGSGEQEVFAPLLSGIYTCEKNYPCTFTHEPLLLDRTV